MNQDYRFGTEENEGGERLVLRIKGDAEVELPIGHYCSVTNNYPDMNVTHDFKPCERIREDTDSEGNHYAWYYIQDYHRTVDRVPRVDAELEQINANIAYLSMMTDVDMMPMDDEGSDMM